MKNNHVKRDNKVKLMNAPNANYALRISIIYLILAVYGSSYLIHFWNFFCLRLKNTDIFRHLRQ